MERPMSVSRQAAERVLQRAAALEQEERAAADDSFTPEQIRAAAEEVGLPNSMVRRAAGELLYEHTQQTRRHLFTYSAGSGILAAVAGAGLIASGQVYLAIPFIVLDLVLAARTLTAFEDQAAAEEEPFRALSDGESDRHPLA